MARQTGIIQLSGPLGGISFYKHKKYGMLARACNPVSAQRIAKDPAFARTRENGTEFGMASRAGKLLRDGLHGFLQDVPTEELDLRVMRLMMDLKAQDTVSARGQRQVGIALGLQPALPGGFEFNGTCGLGRFLMPRPVVDVAQGTITIRDFPAAAAYVSPRGWLDHVPKQATHVVVTGFRGRINFGKGERDFRFSTAVELSIETTLRGGESVAIPIDLHLPSQRSSASLPSGDVVLRLPEPQGDTGVELWGLKIVFVQAVNGVKYTLNTGAAEILESHAVPVTGIPEGISLQDVMLPVMETLPEDSGKSVLHGKLRVTKQAHSTRRKPVVSQHRELMQVPDQAPEQTTG
jgi:hypothetical protein